MKHLPNTLTILRIVIAPIVIALLFFDTFAAKAWALGLFVAASISDWLDGSIARRYAVGSRLGQFLDPLADKFLVLGTFAALAAISPWLVPWWAVAVIALRDAGVTGLRVWHERNGRSLRTSGGAKWKTAFQLTFLILVLLLLTLAELPPAVARPAVSVLRGVFLQGLLIATVAATVLTGLAYFQAPRHVA